MFSASGISNTTLLQSDPTELCDGFKLLLQEKQAGNISDIINDEIVVILDKLLGCNSISKKQHKQFLIKFSLLHSQTQRKGNYKYLYNCTYTQT